MVTNLASTAKSYSHQVVVKYNQFSKEYIFVVQHVFVFFVFFAIPGIKIHNLEFFDPLFWIGDFIFVYYFIMYHFYWT